MSGPVELASLYRTMRTIRRFEERIVDLVNANEIAGVTHEYVGQEAVAVGICAALRPDDVITSTHRGHGHVIAKGADVGRMMAELLGRDAGLNRGRGGSMHIADVSLGIYGANGMVGAGGAIAAGAAWAAQGDGSGRVAISFFGDGAINQGVLLEAMNLAGAWTLPEIFVCENNGYAVTMPSSVATSGTLLARAQGFGMHAEAVDGMDVEAVQRAAESAVERARAGEGPTFLECRTYRFFGHSTAERAQGLAYRADDEVAEWRLQDPVERAGAALPESLRAEIDAAVEGLLDDAIAFARAAPAPDPASAADFMYASGLQPRAGAVA